MDSSLLYKNLKITGYRDGDLPKIAGLFSIAFNGREINEASWKWRMLHNTAGRPYIVNIWDGEALVGHTALIPAYALLQDRKVLAACSGSTMAHPDYPGMFVLLSKACAEIYTDVNLVYGYPNKNSFRISEKYLGHKHIGDICFWKKKPDFFRKCGDIHKIACFTEEHDGLAGEIAKGHSFIIDRNRAYLNWRFADKPGNTYRLFEYKSKTGTHGYMVLNEYHENDSVQGQVIDIIAENEEIFCTLMQYAECFFIERECDIVKLWMTSYRFGRVLKEMGYDYGLQPFPMMLWDKELSLSETYITLAASDVF